MIGSTSSIRHIVEWMSLFVHTLLSFQNDADASSQEDASYVLFRVDDSARECARCVFFYYQEKRSITGGSDGAGGTDTAASHALRPRRSFRR